MFVGRTRELATLEKAYHSSSFEFVVLYGRRRVGKTALLTQFLADKEAIYTVGVESNERQNLENFSKSILSEGKKSLGAISFRDYQSALEEVFQRANSKRIVLAIDEYPYIARATQSLSSTLQALIDAHKNTSHLMLILSGSSLSFMEDQVLAYKAPLYGRRTAQIKLQPLDFAESSRFFPQSTPEELALSYGALGGIPQYLQEFDRRKSFKENVENTFLNPNSYLFEEPERVLKMEIREPATYNAIITAIASGASRMSESANKVGENTNTCTAYLKTLQSLGIIRKELPYGDNAKRKSRYSIADNMFRFWFRFVTDNSQLIALGAHEAAYQRIEPFLSEYMGSIFEEICRQYLWTIRIKGIGPIAFDSLGRWWGNNPEERQSDEIDIIGEQDRKHALFAECKWTNALTGDNVLTTLIRRTKLFAYSHTHLYIFTKTGFTDSCKEMADQTANVSLVTYAEILERIVFSATKESQSE